MSAGPNAAARPDEGSYGANGQQFLGFKNHQKHEGLSQLFKNMRVCQKVYIVL